MSGASAAITMSLTYLPLEGEAASGGSVATGQLHYDFNALLITGKAHNEDFEPLEEWVNSVPIVGNAITQDTSPQARFQEAQINGRNAISWEEKFRLDLWYVEHQSVWLDLCILALTLVRVIAGEGISEPGKATATPFRGSGRG